MRVLIIKLGATGDVVRTTPLLHILNGETHWITSDANCVMLEGIGPIGRLIPWTKADTIRGVNYDLVINLEDSPEAASLIGDVRSSELFGAYTDDSGRMVYTESSREWFDLSLISSFGKKKADDLKLRNRKTYQELIFEGLGYKFKGERYFLPRPVQTGLKGDIAIAEKSGAVWPMKNWAYYKELKEKLEARGYVVNYLPMRKTLRQHIGDVQGHGYLISGDTLPMHIAIGSGIKCLSIFLCTSPWEIYDYGIQKKMISPFLERYFYKRGFEMNAVTAIGVQEVYEEIVKGMGTCGKKGLRDEDKVIGLSAKD